MNWFQIYIAQVLSSSTAQVQGQSWRSNDEIYRYKSFQKFYFFLKVINLLPHNPYF